MPSKMSADQIMTREYLEIRGKILELAASFDRLDRAAPSEETEDRRRRLHEALRILQQNRSDRAEAIQLLLSRPYEEDWRASFGWDRDTVRVNKAR